MRRLSWPPYPSSSPNPSSLNRHRSSAPVMSHHGSRSSPSGRDRKERSRTYDGYSGSGNSLGEYSGETLGPYLTPPWSNATPYTPSYEFDIGRHDLTSMSRRAHRASSDNRGLFPLPEEGLYLERRSLQEQKPLPRLPAEPPHSLLPEVDIRSSPQYYPGPQPSVASSRQRRAYLEALPLVPVPRSSKSSRMRSSSVSPPSPPVGCAGPLVSDSYRSSSSSRRSTLSRSSTMTGGRYASTPPTSLGPAGDAGAPTGMWGHVRASVERKFGDRRASVLPEPSQRNGRYGDMSFLEIEKARHPHVMNVGGVVAGGRLACEPRLPPPYQDYGVCRQAI